MENTSKALLIAAAVLIVILIITVGIKIVSTTKGVDATSKQTGDAIEDVIGNATGTVIEQLGGSNSGSGQKEENTEKEENIEQEEDIEQEDTNEKFIKKDQSYVGYYADVNGDGTVDGVIYADLAVGRDRSYYYQIDKIKNPKNYYISQIDYQGSFGKKDVLCAIGEGNERFYVMALTDFHNGNRYSYHWYDAAKNMNDYKSTTSKKFGTGRTNTENVINRWNNRAYGGQDAGLYTIRLWRKI